MRCTSGSFSAILSSFPPDTNILTVQVLTRKAPYQATEYPPGKVSKNVKSCQSSRSGELQFRGMLFDSSVNFQRNGQGAAAVLEWNHGLLARSYRVQERADFGAQRFFGGNRRLENLDFGID